MTDDEKAASQLQNQLMLHNTKSHDFTNPLIFAVPIQLLAYHTAVIMGTDVDQPRNLAKSVTVE